jgi:general secretion pathway protein M
MAKPGHARRERWLALGLLLALLGLLHVLVLHPAWVAPMRALDQRADALQERQARSDAHLRQAPAIAQRLAEVEAALAGRPGFLAEESPELASAGLVRRLDEEVAAASPDGSGCAIDNRSPLPAVPGETRFVRVAVRATLRCGVPELAAVLHALESGSPRLFVDNLVIGAHSRLDEQDGAGGLDASFDLTGYLDPATSAASPPGPADAP